MTRFSSCRKGDDNRASIKAAELGLGLGLTLYFSLSLSLGAALSSVKI